MTRTQSKSLTVTLRRGPGAGPGAGEGACSIDEDGIVLHDNLNQLAAPYRRTKVAFSELAGASLVFDGALYLQTRTGAVRPVGFSDVSAARCFARLVRVGAEAHERFDPDPSQPEGVREAQEAEATLGRKRARKRLLELLEEAREAFGDEVVLPLPKPDYFEPEASTEVRDVLSLTSPAEADCVLGEFIEHHAHYDDRKLVCNLPGGGYAEIGASESYEQDPRRPLRYHKSIELYLYGPDGSVARSAARAEVIALLREAAGRPAYVVATSCSSASYLI